MQKTTLFTLGAGLIILIGVGVVVYFGRPVMRIEETANTNTQVNQNANTQDTSVSDNDDDENEGDDDDDTSVSSGSGSAPSTGSGISSSNTSSTTKTYTSAEVAQRNVQSNCWASVDANVYDLTTWVSRHPGGSGAITALCGTDATAKFTRKHGNFDAAKAALALLKIGTLAN